MLIFHALDNSDKSTQYAKRLTLCVAIFAPHGCFFLYFYFRKHIYKADILQTINFICCTLFFYFKNSQVGENKNNILSLDLPIKCFFSSVKYGS